MKKIKVLLIEDNRLLRDGTTAMLNEQHDIRAISTSSTRGAFETARKLAPDVVLLDLGLRSQNSLKVLETIKQKFPRAEVIVMDLIPIHSEVATFVKAGVSGFVPKDASLDVFLNTIRTVVTGAKVLPATLADSLFSQIVEQAIQTGTVNRVVKAVKMTTREKQIIALLAQGKCVNQVSKHLKLALHTTKSHIRSILDKLALHARLELASFARMNSK